MRLRLFFAFFAVFTLMSFSQAQDDAVLPQANSNATSSRPLAISAVLNRTFVSSWQQVGWTGAGRRIGVLDRGFGGLLTFEQRTGATTRTALNIDKASYDAQRERHGTQVLEVIHTIAPGAELHVCEYRDLDSFVLCINWMIIQADVHIINHSVGVPASEGQAGWTQEVENVAQNQVLWVNAAGNFAEGFFQQAFTDRDPNGRHDYSAVQGLIEDFEIAPAGSNITGAVMLTWEGLPGRPAETINLDLEVHTALGGFYGSYNPQSGQPGERALEYVRIPMNETFYVRVLDADWALRDAAGVEFDLYVEFADMPGSDNIRSILSPGDAPSALTVGAQQLQTHAPYSSCGPTLANVQKPDLIAPGELLLDSGPFVGTSAAAPLVAGIAALLWEANPTWDVPTVRNAIRQQVGGGADFFCAGNGRVALAAPQTTPTPIAALPTPTNTLPAPTATDTPQPEPTQVAAAQFTVGINVLREVQNIVELEALPDGGSQPYNYLWLRGDCEPTGRSDSPRYGARCPGPGTYQLDVVVFDGAGQQAQESVQIEIAPPTATNTPPPATATPTASPTPRDPALAALAAWDALGRENHTNAAWQPLERDFGDGVPMVLVPGGCFMMGSNERIDEQPVHEVCVDAFWIDKTEVTQADFERLGGQKARANGFDGAQRPVERITWFEARDFCAARGGQLPTEAQWEYAARGPDALVYPWGNAWNPDNANWADTSLYETFPVGSFPAGASWVGALDMSGNLWEWVSSQYVNYPYDEDDGREDMSGANVRGLRGGSFFNTTNNLRAAIRNWSNDLNSFNSDGFRCSRSYEQ